MTATNGHPEKSFDCVDMKRRIQEELEHRQAGQSRESLNAAAEKTIANDPHLRRLQAATPSSGPGPSVRKAG